MIGVNYANDYSDGIRGTDDDRVGPLRLVGSGCAAPAAVRTAALVACSRSPALAGLTLVSLSEQWWLLAVGAVCIAGGLVLHRRAAALRLPGLGEVAVFVFFGPVAVLGTVLTQSGPPGALAVVAAVGVGHADCAVLVANNLRDIPTDTAAGKRTLAVLLGDRDTRRLYAALVAAPFLLSAWRPGCAAGRCCSALLALPLAVSRSAAVLGGAEGRDADPGAGPDRRCCCSPGQC